MPVTNGMPGYGMSPRVYQVLTCFGKAKDGAGILQRLESEIRMRAYAVWQETGNPNEAENWLEAERRLIKEMDSRTPRARALDTVHEDVTFATGPQKASLEI